MIYFWHSIHNIQFNRLQINPNDSNIADVMEYYNQINDLMLEYLTKEIKDTNSSDLWR